MKKSELTGKISKKAQWTFEAILDLTFDYHGKKWQARQAGTIVTIDTLVQYIQLLKRDELSPGGFTSLLNSVKELLDSGLIELSERNKTEYIDGKVEIKQTPSVFFPMITRKEYYS